jgi:hypothetical protein
VLLTIEGAGLGAVDSLQISAAVDGGAAIMPVMPEAVDGGQLTFPHRVLAQFPDKSYRVTFNVRALRGQTVVAEAASSVVTITPHEVGTATITLGNSSDMGTPGDMSSPGEMSSPGDMSSAGDMGCAALACHCGVNSYILSDDFEGATFSSFWAQPDPGIMLDSTQAFSGHGSVHMVVTGTAGHFAEDRLFADLSRTVNPLHLRARLRLHQSTPQLASQMFARVPSGAAVYSLTDTYLPQVAAENWTGTTANATGTQVLAQDAWHCVEMTIQLSGAANDVDVRTSIDGPDRPELHLSGFSANADQPFVQIAFSHAATFTADGTSELWVDELIVDDKPIGCP